MDFCASAPPAGGIQGACFGYIFLLHFGAFLGKESPKTGTLFFGAIGAAFIKSDELRSRPAALFYVLLYAKSTIPNARHDSRVIF